MKSEYYVDRFTAYCKKVDMTPEELATLAQAQEQNPYANTEASHVSFTTPNKNLVTSIIKSYGIHQNAPEVFSHAPVIDLDVPCELIPSSQLGHYHLYIHHPISWPSYTAILKSLADAKIIESGYYSASLSRGYTAVRLPGVVKPGIPVTISSVLQANAILRRNLYLSEVGYKNQQDKIDLLSSKLLEFIDENQLSELLASISDPPQVKPKPLLIGSSS